MQLPPIMVAPNGARLTKADHPAVPMTIAELAQTARACSEAGAGAMHFHVRDADGAHVLDAGLFREALAEIAHAAPGILPQVTTEAVGRYPPEAMRALVRDVRPRDVSIGTVELIPDGRPSAEDVAFARFMADEGIEVQHILYRAHEIDTLVAWLEASGRRAGQHSVLFALGHYLRGPQSRPDLIDPFLAAVARHGLDVDWAICAFAETESVCLEEAIRRGGKIRVGFENSRHNADGSIAADNAARVGDAARLAKRVLAGAD